MSKDLEVKHYKVLSLSPNLDKNAVYYLFDQNTGKVKTFITTKDGIPIPLIDLTTVGSVLSVTGTGVTGTSTNPKVDIATFVSTQLGNQVYLSLSDGKLQVNPITSPDNSLEVTSTSTELQVQLSAAIQSQINTALQPGANISELTNDVGYITIGDLVGTDLTYTPSATNGIVESSTGTDAIIPLAGVLNAGLLSPSEKASIASAVQPEDLATVATTGDYGDLINIPTEFTPEAHTHSITDISGTKSEFDAALTDGNFLFVGDITQYTDELAQDAVGNILTDTATIDLSYNDGSNQITADLKNTTVSAGTYGTASSIPVISFDAQGRATNAVNQPISITSSSVTDFNEAAQDAVGGILTDTSTIDFSYNDGSNTISADVKPNSIDASHLNNSINVSEFVNDADYTTVAASQAYADSLVVGLWDDRGAYDASSNLFPSTGGSGTSGAVLKGDIWTISVAGTLGGYNIQTRQTVRALVDSPAQISSNWAIGLADPNIQDSIVDGVLSVAPSQNAVFDALALKYDASNPNGYETPAQLNTRDTNNRNRANHTGTQLLSTISDVTITSTNLNTLDDGVNTTLHFHDSDRARANHTGTQLASTISDFTTAARTAAVQDSITDAVTTIAPSQNAVYDALQLKKNATSTAITSLATLTNNGTTFTLSSFTGVIVNNATVPAGITNVTFAGASNVTPLYLRTILYVNSSGTLVQFNGATTDLTPQQKRDNLFVGLVVYIGGTVSVVQLTPNIEYNIDNRFGDLADFLGNINQGNTISANGANLQLNKGSGFTFRRGSNYVANRAVPDVTTDAAATPIPAGVNLVGYRNGSGGWTYEAFTGSLTPTFWDNGSGTKQTVANNRFTNQQLYFFNGTDTYIVYLGQAEYTSLEAAKTAANTAAGVVVDPGTSPASLRATISIEKGCTSLLNTTLSYITQGPKISGGNSAGAGTGSQNLQSVYNNSSTPQILTSTTLGSIDFQRGSTADTDNVFRILNGAGTNTFSITGNGNITANSFIKFGGTSAQFLKADGSIDSNSYLIGSGLTTSFNTKWNGTSIVNSIISDNGTDASITGDLTFANSKGFILSQSGTNRNLRISNLGGNDNQASVHFIPNSGTNVGTSFFLIPKGTGFNSTNKTVINLYNTDVVSSPTNIEFMNIQASGNYFQLTTGKTSSGTLRPLLFSAGFGDNTTNPNQQWLYTSGRVGFNTTSDNGTDQVQVNGSLIATSLKKSGVTSTNILLAGGGDLAQSTFATATGGTGYIQNQNSSAQSANMWISGNGTFENGLQIRNSTPNLSLFAAGVAEWNTGIFESSGLYRIKANNTIDALILSPSNGAATFSSTVTATSFIASSGTVRLKNYTVSTLPAGTQGDTAYVTDATAPTYLGTLTGGGSVVCPVFFDGTAWVSH